VFPSLICEVPETRPPPTATTTAALAYAGDPDALRAAWDAVGVPDDDQRRAIVAGFQERLTVLPVGCGYWHRNVAERVVVG
jgi:hypothetical protein